MVTFSTFLNQRGVRGNGNLLYFFLNGKRVEPSFTSLNGEGMTTLSTFLNGKGEELSFTSLSGEEMATLSSFLNGRGVEQSFTFW